MLTDRIRDVDRIYGVHRNIDVEDRVARSIRIGRRYFLTIDECSVFVEDLIRLTVPPCTITLTTMNVDRRVIRMCDRQVQGVELSDVTFCIIGRIGIRTRGVQRIRIYIRTLMYPDIRIFLIRRSIFRCVGSTDDLIDAQFLNHIQVVNAIATACCSTRLRIIIHSACSDHFTMPEDGVAFVQDTRLRQSQFCYLLNLVVNDTVATRHIRIRNEYGVAVDAIGL